MNKYIPNPDNVKVGYGYRLLDENEIRKAGDEIQGIADHECNWLKINNSSYFGKTLNELYKDIVISKYYYYRRAIEIPEGYRLLDKSECPIDDNYKYIVYHSGLSSNGKWADYGLNGHGDRTVWDLYCSGDNHIDINGVAYIVPIENKIMKNDNVEDLKKQLEAAKIAAENAKAEVEKLNEVIKKSEFNFKVGDYVVHTSTHYLYKISKIRQDYNNLQMEGYETVWVPSQYHRKATNQEIEKYLLDKAAKDGWVVGANIKRTHISYKDMVKKIDRLSVYFGEYSIHTTSGLTGQYWDEVKSPFVVAHWDNISSAPINRFLELVKEEPITITVNGTIYTAEIIGNLAKFGCAEITRKQIEKSLELLSNTTLSISGNRKIESVQIGKGIFTKELLEKLVKKFNEINPHKEISKFKKGDWIIATRKVDGHKWEDAYRFHEYVDNGLYITYEDHPYFYGFDGFVFELAPEGYPKVEEKHN